MAFDRLTWTVSRYSDRIAIGDIVYLWKAGENRGIYAVAEVVGEPSARTPFPVDDPYWLGDRSGTEQRCMLEISQRLLSQPLMLPELEDRGLGSLSILRQPAGTNFAVSPAEAAVLAQIASTRKSFLVGAVKEPHLALVDHIQAVSDDGSRAVWWSFPLSPRGEEILRDYPYLHIYSGVPKQQISHRYRVLDWRTSFGNEGMASPWPDSTILEELDLTQKGSSRAELFKTWFLVGALEELPDPIDLTSLSREDGSRADPSGLLGGFQMWKLKTNGSAEGTDNLRLGQLSEMTNLDVDVLTELEELVLEKRQLIFQGPPGCGKTFVGDLLARYLTGNPLQGDHDDRYVVVQFHQSYSYEDFVQGIRPETGSDGQIRYEVKDGVFRQLCARADKNRSEQFVLLIDEINRGNISRIFGELLMLLEYRDQEAHLTYSVPGADSFSIPPNVIVLGTMNTADRSLAQIDYALRRRFYFYSLQPVVEGSAPVLARWLEKQEMSPAARASVLSLFIALNRRVQAELDEHFQVGHSYFMHPDIFKEERQDRIWRHEIEPLLEEYFYNRRDRADLIESFDREKIATADEGQS